MFVPFCPLPRSPTCLEFNLNCCADFSHNSLNYQICLILLIKLDLILFPIVSLPNENIPFFSLMNQRNRWVYVERLCDGRQRVNTNKLDWKWPANLQRTRANTDSKRKERKTLEIKSTNKSPDKAQSLKKCKGKARNKKSLKTVYLSEYPAIHPLSARRRHPVQ